ncbi:MAG: glycoside hydrolase family 97 catalytic domain-containing protein, partial [Prevotella sp.]|nr:glycoside hydrolase family 97 catalytic domain-containing protein [Prevotella sp.]
KRKDNHYEANQQTYTFAKDGKDVLKAIFQVSNSNVAFRYEILNSKKDAMCAVVNDEATGFFMNDETTTFICPQMGEMTGFARTAPSYETHYAADEAMGRNGWGHGYTFPCLFKAPGNDGKPVWILVSETGMNNYPGCKIVNNGAGNYKISFPSQKENNGYGSTGAQISLPDKTPWRTLTVTDNLKDIVETTVTWDVLSTEHNNDARINKMREAHKAGYGRGAWSWIIADDASCNYDTQKEYIDFAAAMGWESLLIDAQWDRQIGRERIAELARYGKTKGVYLYLWYNSNGNWNDAPQTPRHCLSTATARQQEMAWLKQTGIRGIKVDFFGGDKQCTMELYRDILADALKHDIKVIFHGCTLPRGWEMLYPNYVASEAVRASENLRFSQGECDREAMDATFLPFLRNAVGSMDFGGSTLNWYYNKYNQPGKGGGHRITSDVFALATAVLFQSPVQHFAMAPGNLTDAPAWALDFMKQVPTTWEDIRFIDGYPGKYVVLARKSQQGKWYLTAINGTKETLKLRLPVDMFAVGQTVNVYSDKATKDVTPAGSVKKVKIGKKQTMEAVIPVNGAFLVTE